jgi:lipoate-protein ligase A
MTTTQRAAWRLVRSGFSDACENMAVDEALMLSCAEGASPPTLRLYGWRPPGVSLGYFQPVDDQIDQAECARRGYSLVRRPTGGRAILHDDEVTYSVTGRQSDIPGGEKVLSSYREISRGIEVALRRIGVEAGMAREGARVGEPRALRLGIPTVRGSGQPVPHGGSGSGGRAAPAACFAKAARSDMTVDGRKIVGSAQARRHGAILQHGSIPLGVNVADVAAVMAPDGRACLALAETAISVSDAVGRDVSFEEMCEALVAGFEEGLNVTLVPGELSPEERERVAHLRETKYGTDGWNLEALSGRRRSEADLPA